MEVNRETEMAFERYYSQERFSANPYWIYIGLFSLISIAVLAGAILDWNLTGDVSRALPGVHLPSETTYLFIAGNAFELKSVEYLLAGTMGMVLLGSYVMATK